MLSHASSIFKLFSGDYGDAKVVSIGEVTDHSLYVKGLSLRGAGMRMYSMRILEKLWERGPKSR
jgi:uncharacterized protein YdiU (UPF0061 family)